MPDGCAFDRRRPLWRRRPGRLWLWRGRWFRIVGRARHVEPDQFAADGDRRALAVAEREHGAADGRGDFHRRLVGHDLGEHLVLAHDIADGDMPADKLDLGYALADVRNLDDARAHAQSSMTVARARAMRAGPGK